MSFNSSQFVFLFLFVFFAYWAISRTRNLRFVLLLAASYVFYMSWDARFIVLILASTLLDYYLGGAIHRSDAPGRRKLCLTLSLVGNLGLLAYFKYFNFFAENVVETLRGAGLSGLAEFTPWNIILPVGISFYTFQSLSYTIDIYRRQLEPTDSLLKFALFVTFFPQLVAGPIVRAREFLPQLDQPARFDDRDAQRGLFLILVGMVKKMALADVLGTTLVAPVYADPGAYHPLQVLLAVWGALFQFYLDFSAYSDIAIGCAACLGFKLPRNFDRPFLAQSIGEFWSRWHISLSTWFRDYVFFSLGGTRARLLGRFRNVLVTMFLVGLWHGAGWNYVIWGTMHGLASFAGMLFPHRSRAQLEARSVWNRGLRRLGTFNLVALSMLFFANGSVLEGNRGLVGSVEMLGAFAQWGRPLASLPLEGLVAMAAAVLLHFTPVSWPERLLAGWRRLPSPAQAGAMILVAGVLANLAYAANPFIYFQF